MRADNAPDQTLDALLPPTDSTLTATVFVHSLGPAECKSAQDQLMTELMSLADRGMLDDIDLVVWGNSICTSSPLTEVGGGQRILDTIGAFYDLAANSELSIAPFFNVSTVTTEYNPEAFSRVVPPSRAVAIYEEGELAAVFPCLLDGTTYTPEKLVSHLARERTADSGPVVLDESA